MKTEAWRLYRSGDFESALPRLKAQLQPASRPASQWLAIAHSYFALRRYNDAMKATSHALKLKPNDPYAINLKASILTEKGVDTRNKAALLKGRRIFESISDETADWSVLYNRGRNLDALGLAQEAVVFYQRSLELNPNHAEAWKNLGTCFFELGEHEKEFQCYEHALQLNPCLPEALASKATSLMAVKQDYSSAIKLLELVISDCEEFATEHYTVYYWLAHAYAKAQSLDSALDAANKGLATHSQDPWLLRIKASILHSIWRKDPSYHMQSVQFFEEMLEADPDDAASFRELCELFLKTDKHDKLGTNLEAWCTRKLGYNCVPFLRDLGVSLDALSKSLNTLDAYLSFREICPVSRYFNSFAEVGFNTEDNFPQVLNSIFGITFGLLYDFAREQADDEQSDEEAMLSIGLQAFELAKEYTPLIATSLGKQIKESKATDLKTKLFSTAIVILPELAIHELSSQTGFVASRLGLKLTPHTLDTPINNMDFKSWQDEFMRGVITHLNSTAQLLPEE